MKIQLPHCQLEFTPTGANTRWYDGAEWGALPHPEMPHYQHLAFAMGYEGDTLRYAQEHELSHHVVAESFGECSHVLWQLAHRLPCDPFRAAAEEALAMALQRYARTNAHPFVDHVDWEALRDRMKELLSC